jgi:hypothetical protein
MMGVPKTPPEKSKMMGVPKTSRKLRKLPKTRLRSGENLFEPKSKVYNIHEMLGTNMRAMFQRRRGRDLFDLYWALTKSASPIGPSAVIEFFEHYMKQEGTRAGRSEYIGILEAHLKDRGFCSDTESLLRFGISYDPQAAGKYAITHLLRKLPE